MLAFLTDSEIDLRSIAKGRPKLINTANYDAFAIVHSAPTIAPMDLDERDVREFAEIWKKEFKEDLTLEEARRNGSQLVELFSLLAKPLPSEERQPPPMPHNS
jgi:hypothetical protein